MFPLFLLLLYLCIILLICPLFLKLDKFVYKLFDASQKLYKNIHLFKKLKVGTTGVENSFITKYFLIFKIQIFHILFI